MSRLPSPYRRPLLASAALAVAVMAVLGASHAVRPGAFAGAFADVRWSWVVLSAIAYACCQITSALVWHAGLRAGGLGAVGRGRAIGAHWISRGASEFVPAPVGEAARVAALRRHRVAREGGAWRIIGSIGAYRLVDGGVSLVVVALLAVVLPLPDGVAAVRWVALAAVVGLAVAVVAVARLGLGRTLGLLPRGMRPRAAQLADGARLLSSGRAIVPAIALQLATVAGRVLSVAALLAAFGMPPTAAPLVYCLTTLAGLVAISPGGIGVREAAVVPTVAVTYGLSVEPVLAFSLALQATAMAVSLVGAAATLALTRGDAPGASAPAPAPVPAPLVDL